MTTKKVVKQPSVSNLLATAQAKFAELAKINAQINKNIDLYKQHDALVEELMPLFIEVTPDAFITKRSITIGSKTYKFHPSFYDEKKSRLVAKVWRSAAHKSGQIEVV
jgi:hypothetical protein